MLKEGCNDRAVRHILKRLDKALKKLLQFFLATHPEHEVENVEIKGTPPIITWKWGPERQIEFMQSGDFAKLPREILDRFDEFKNTTVSSFDDIYDLEEKVDRIVIPESQEVVHLQAEGFHRQSPDQ